MGGNREKYRGTYYLATGLGHERSAQLHQASLERRDRVLRDRRPRGVARTIRQKASRGSRRTTGKLVGRVGTGNTPDGSWPSQTEGNQAGTRDPATSNRPRGTADLREEEYESIPGVVYDFRADFVIPDSKETLAFIEVRKSSSRHASLYAKDKMFSAVNWKGNNKKLIAVLIYYGEWTKETLKIMKKVLRIKKLA